MNEKTVTVEMSESEHRLFLAAPKLLDACKAALDIVSDDAIQGLLNEAIAEAEQPNS